MDMYALSIGLHQYMLQGTVRLEARLAQLVGRQVQQQASQELSLAHAIASVGGSL